MNNSHTLFYIRSTFQCLLHSIEVCTLFVCTFILLGASIKRAVVRSRGYIDKITHQECFWTPVTTRVKRLFISFNFVINYFYLISGKRVRRRDIFLERAAEDVSSQARRIRAETYVTGTADKQDPTAVSEPPGRQWAPSKAAANGEGLSNQRHH